LGFVAWETGQKPQAIQLVALSFLIFNAITSDNAKRPLNKLADMKPVLCVSEEQMKEIMQKTMVSYQRDCGASLLLCNET
jgi:hypothetical protein